ncbi:transferase [Rhypophila decipiens]|uniref:Transferase n=1 Tax=Rhypophila decipiens TaxID=261697 RepID=A0AAN6Y801_9PEZI|nr:transferase [Rhypophila decipiens]
MFSWLRQQTAAMFSKSVAPTMCRLLRQPHCLSYFANSTLAGMKSPAKWDHHMHQRSSTTNAEAFQVAGEAATAAVETSPPNQDVSSQYRHEPLVLSDLDLISPNTLVSSFLVYKLGPEHDLDLVTEALRQGLGSAAKQIPTLGARIRFEDGKPLTQLSPGAVKLKVRHFEHHEHKSYDELAAAQFRPSEFQQGRLVPVEAYDSLLERPVLVAQLSFIPGGAILALGFNHIASDGVSRSIALSAICKASKSRMQVTSVTPSHASGSFDFRRQALAAPSELLRLHKEQLVTQIKDYTVIDAGAMAAAAKGAATAKAGMANMKNKTALYSIKGAALQKLKQSCIPIEGISTYLSTYDCVSALLWRCLMRARTRLRPHLLSDNTRMLHAVDLRSRFKLSNSFSLAKTYFGNAVGVAPAGPLPMSTLLSDNDDGLSLAASTVRSSILSSAAPSSILAATALGHKTLPSENIMFMPSRGIADGDFMLSGWGFMKTAEYDFGLGAPRAVTPPDVAIPGFAFMFPDCERGLGGTGRTYEICLTLPAEEQDLLCQDDEFRRWFGVRTW